MHEYAPSAYARLSNRSHCERIYEVAIALQERPNLALQHACAVEGDAAGDQRREDHDGKRAAEPDKGGFVGPCAGSLDQEAPGSVKETGGQHQSQGEVTYEQLQHLTLVFDGT
jgi:hypothetical protein